VAVAFDNLTLSQRVYEHLRDEILADHLLPGTELSEVALSKELAISRGPIREAMGRLAAEGLITMRPRRRAEVRSLTPQELIDAYQVREALEVMAVRLLIRRVTEADLARLEELIDQMAAHSAEGAVREFFTANVSFHELLCELSGNPKLQEVHHRLEGEIGRFQNRTLALRGSMDDSLTEHRAILAAVRLRDADRAAALTAEHIRVPAERLQATLRDSAASDPSAPGPSAPDASGPRLSAPGPSAGSGPARTASSLTTRVRRSTRSVRSSGRRSALRSRIAAPRPSTSRSGPSRSPARRFATRRSSSGPMPPGATPSS